MLAGSGLDSLCHIADTPEEMADACRRLMNEPFTAADVEMRKAFLVPAYSTAHLAARLYQMI
jgi:hypothetical protein